MADSVTFTQASAPARVERALLALLVLGKLFVALVTWGISTGFDRGPYLEMVRSIRGLDLPPVDELFYSYHPPLCFLLTRGIMLTGLGAARAAQVHSFLAVFASFLVARHVMKSLGLLRSFPGLLLLYGSFSMPIVIGLSWGVEMESTVLLCFILVLQASVACFFPVARAQDGPTRVRLRFLWLGVCLALGLYTKFTCLLFLAVPVLCLIASWAVAQRPLREVARASGRLAGSFALTGLLAAPFYGVHYYAETGTFLPGNVEKFGQPGLAANRDEVDRDLEGVLWRLLTVNVPDLRGRHDSINDNWYGSFWFQLWRRDPSMGYPPDPEGRNASPPRVRSIGDFYLGNLRWFLVGGWLLFVVTVFRRRMTVLEGLGLVLLVFGVVLVVAQLAFALNTPKWDWQPLKAKYIIPAVFTVVYGLAYTATLGEALPPGSRVQRALALVVVALLALFVGVNHFAVVY
ncbi:MAG: hypothetical protein HY904_02765 [Deltaproteobacteria bacterium]|nr:hypothetical protein [Deltaproteobacteria bacterium]